MLKSLTLAALLLSTTPILARTTGYGQETIIQDSRAYVARIWERHAYHITALWIGGRCGIINPVVAGSAIATLVNNMAEIKAQQGNGMIDVNDGNMNLSAAKQRAEDRGEAILQRNPGICQNMPPADRALLRDVARVLN